MKPKPVKSAEKNKFSFMCTKVLPDKSQQNKPKRVVKIFRTYYIIISCVFLSIKFEARM